MRVQTSWGCGWFSMRRQIIPRFPRKRRPWLAQLAIIGGAARGAVFVIVGGTAINAALHAGRSRGDMPGAFRTIIHAPMGRVLLGVIAAGLAAFAVWCLLEAILDTTRKGSDAKGLARRAAGVFVACLYFGLSFFALRVTLDLAHTRGSKIQGWTALFLSQPLGQWLVGIAGALIISAGLYQIGQAIRGEFGSHDGKWARWLHRYGLASRAVLFLVTGGFMLVAAFFRAPAEARGISGAFRFLEAQPVGWVLVCAIGAGLAVHGVMLGIGAFRSHGKDAGYGERGAR